MHLSSKKTMINVKWGGEQNGVSNESGMRNACDKLLLACWGRTLTLPSSTSKNRYNHKTQDRCLEKACLFWMLRLRKVPGRRLPVVYLSHATNRLAIAQTGCKRHPNPMHSSENWTYVLNNLESSWISHCYSNVCFWSYIHTQEIWSITCGFSSKVLRAWKIM